MPTLVAAVEAFMRSGSIGSLQGFNANQVAQEQQKHDFLQAAPELRFDLLELEDMDLLRGGLAAFELDSATFQHRARMFRQLMDDPAHWDSVQATLHTVGNCARRPNHRMFQVGSRHNAAPWRAVLTGLTGGGLPALRAALAQILDALPAAGGNLPTELQRLRAAWLQAAEAQRRFDWRYYFVKYPLMRDGRSGLYAGRDEVLGYDVCMLDMTIMSSNYRDPFLSAMCEASGVEDQVEKLKFTGYEDRPRYLRRVRSGIGLRSAADGIRVHFPENVQPDTALAILGPRRQQIDPQNWLLPVNQSVEDGQGIDRDDRVQFGADLLRSLVAAGL
jgi:hypothetical protein